MLFLAFWSIAFCVAGIGMGSLASWDEAYYALVSRGIYLSNDWVGLTYFDTPFYDKPPLYMWTTAVFYHLFGVNEFATRLTSGLAGVGLILTTYLLGKRLFNRAAALAGAGILLSSTDFLHYARWGTLDITHLFFFTLAVLFYTKSSERPAAWLGFWISCGLAAMTKGPLVVLLGPIILFDSVSRKDFSFFKNPYFWWGIPLFLLIILPWHWAAFKAHPDLFMKNYFHKNYIARTSAAVEGHTGNWYFYIRTLINKYHPWIILAPIALPWALWKSRAHPNARGLRLLLFWAGLVFFFFTFLVGTKLPWYILLLHPALSLLLGAWAADVIWKGRSVHWINAVTAMALLLHIPFASVIIQDSTPHIETLAPAVRASVPPGTPVVLYEFHEEPVAKFYFERPIRYADSLAELDAIIEKNGSLRMVVPLPKYEELSGEFTKRGFTKLAENGRRNMRAVLLARDGGAGVS